MKPSNLLLLCAMALSGCAFLKEQFGPTERVDHSEAFRINLVGARNAYTQCMEDSAVQFNTSKATAYEIADAAVANCEGEFQEYGKAAFNLTWYEEGAYVPRHRVQELVEDVSREFKQKTRAQVVLIVVESRVPAKAKKKD